MFIIDLPDGTQRGTWAQADHHGIGVSFGRVDLRLVDVVIHAGQVGRTRDTPYLLECVYGEVLLSDRVISPKSAGAEGTRLAQLDQRAHPPFQRGDLLLTRQSRLHHESEAADDEGEQEHHDKCPRHAPKRITNPSTNSASHCLSNPMSICTIPCRSAHVPQADTPQVTRAVPLDGSEEV